MGRDLVSKFLDEPRVPVCGVMTSPTEVQWNGGCGPPHQLCRAGDRQGPQGQRLEPPSTVNPFRAAMKTNPALKALIVSGYFDLVSEYFAIEQAAEKLPPDLASRVNVKTYAGGHAIYTDDAVRHQFRLDAAKFYQAAAK